MTAVFQTNAILVFLPAFFRVGGLMLSGPILRQTQAPAALKIGVALFITVAAWPTLAAGPVPPVTGLVDLGWIVATELVLGLLMGAVASTLLSAVEYGGQLVGISMGLSVVNVLDPSFDIQVSIISRIYALFAAALFLATNAHHVLFRAMLDSFHGVPIGGLALSPRTLLDVVGLGSETLRLGIRIAAPLTAVFLVIEIGLGLLVRMVPQLNVFILGFPLKIGLGLVLLAASLSALVPLLGRIFVRMDQELSLLLQAVTTVR